MSFLGRLLGRPANTEKALSPADPGRGWYRILESFSGAWQRNVEVDRNLVLAQHAVFACMTLIASDIAKLRIKLVQQDASGVWLETTNNAYSPVLRKPNGYQTRAQFIESWVLSKLMRGNAFILKARDARYVVTQLHVLCPDRVRVLVADDGSVFYDMSADNLSGVRQQVVVPATEIINDRYNCLFHPLIGVSPIFANGLAATQGLNIQQAATSLFGNRAIPSGILSAPNSISKETAERLKTKWQENYGGDNTGKVAVLGDGLKFEAMTMKSTDAQVIEQLKWSAEMVASTYHVPPYKIGVGAMPTVSNIQSLNVEYYSQALQRLIEDIEACLDEGLALANNLGTEIDVDGLLRMDSVTQMDVLEKASGVMTIDEKRAKLDLAPVVGGDSVYLQQQNYSLEALAKRDAQDDPFNPGATAESLPAPAANDDEDLSEDEIAEAAKAFAYAEFKEVRPMLMLPKPADRR